MEKAKRNQKTKKLDVCLHDDDGLPAIYNQIVLSCTAMYLHFTYSILCFQHVSEYAVSRSP